MLRQLRELYEVAAGKIARARKKLGRALTLTEKILVAHVENDEWERGKATLRLHVDRVAMQDATAQMALLQFMQSRRGSTAVPATIHCDHLIRAESGAAADLQRAVEENREVYDFLASAASKFGIGFWRPGAGIIHQVVLENYAFPGGLMIGTDSHTPNAGGLGMLAVGVGGADAGEVMSGLPWEVTHPKVIGVHLTGELSGWSSPKDVITYLCALLGTKGGTGAVIEYLGPGCLSISATGKATICNMGAELGATSSIFPFDFKMAQYLEATGRADIMQVVHGCGDCVMADIETWKNPSGFFDQVVEINLDDVRPYIVGPHTPELGRQVSQLAEEARREGWPLAITNCLIGSCTNSSYEDMKRAGSIAAQAVADGRRAKVPFLVTPGSEQIHETMRRDGIIDVLEAAGGQVLANACGPCIGMWKRHDVGPQEPNTIVSSYNRNFPGRNDQSNATLSFLTSPEIVTAMAFAGTLEFDPTRDALPDGFRFAPPRGEELPASGFAKGGGGYHEPASDPESVQVVIDPKSERLQILEPFPAWDGNDFVKLPVLLKAKGKCTTDQISPAGPWLKYRGHLDKISDNMFAGAVNAFTGEVGMNNGSTFAAIARYNKSKGTRWVVIGDENYGEGSSREHAAMSPRHLGCAAVIARSFARIHETNLKKQGILPLTFADAVDYDLFRQNDKVSITGLNEMEPGETLEVTIHKLSGETITLQAQHSLTAEQINWFRSGSALNALMV